MWDRFVANGKKDEEFVLELLVRIKGGRAERASEEEDVKYHVDFWWFPDDSDKKYGVDVKGLKRINRGDLKKSLSISWVELTNVLGEKGWIYGKATYIAFVAGMQVLFVPRRRLQYFAEGTIAGKTAVRENPQRCYVPYQRSGRQDLIVMVSIDDLQRLSSFSLDVNMEG